MEDEALFNHDPALMRLEKKLLMKPAYQRSVFISYQWNQMNIVQTLQHYK